MSSLWLPPTIEDDEEVDVDVDDSDSEEEPSSKDKGRKSAGKRQLTSIFSDDFSFPAETGVGGGGMAEGGWTVEEEVLGWAEKKRDLAVTTLDSKILRTIERRKLKVHLHVLVNYGTWISGGVCEHRPKRSESCRGREEGRTGRERATRESWRRTLCPNSCQWWWEMSHLIQRRLMLKVKPTQ